jgi:hypothetical protein
MFKQFIATAILFAGLLIVPGICSIARGTDQQDLTPTPPAATWTPGPAPAKTAIPVSTAKPVAPAGAQIALQVKFPKTWPWDQIHWQELWTAVQWKDAEGRWHTIEGWQGTLDEAVGDEQGQIVGHKTWWVDESGLGKGPFRWLIYAGETGDLLAAGEPFHLPAAARQTMVVEVNLANTPN